jgi:hypothetical protein
MPDQPDITTRVKFAVRQWCTFAEQQAPLVPITLTTRLDALRPDGYNILRVYVNDEFRDEPRNFPISSQSWKALKAQTVGDVRNEVLDRAET